MNSIHSYFTACGVFILVLPSDNDFFLIYSFLAVLFIVQMLLLKINSQLVEVGEHTLHKTWATVLFYPDSEVMRKLCFQMLVHCKFVSFHKLIKLPKIIINIYLMFFLFSFFILFSHSCHNIFNLLNFAK